MPVCVTRVEQNIKIWGALPHSLFQPCVWLWFIQAVVELLLRYRADVSAASVDHQTPLHVIAANNSLSCLYTLLSYIDDIDITDRTQCTALHHATYNTHSQVTPVCLVFNVM